MTPHRTLAANTRKVPLRMLGNSLRRVFEVDTQDGSFDDLLRRLDDCSMPQRQNYAARG